MDGCIPILTLRFGLFTGLLMLATTQLSAVEPRANSQPSGQAAVRIASLTFVESSGALRPVVEVWSNGVVNATELTGTPQNPVAKMHTDRLSQAELRSLHQALIDEYQLATQTTEQVQTAIETASIQQQLTAHVEGAAATEIGVRIGREWRTVRCPAVSILATRFPQVIELQQIAAAQDRLQNVAAVALLGGAKAADQQAITATNKLREMHPDAGVITRRDLLMVRRLPNQSQFVQFRYAGPPGAEESYLVNMTQTPEGPTRVSVMDSPTVVR